MNSLSFIKNIFSMTVSVIEIVKTMNKPDKPDTTVVVNPDATNKLITKPGEPLVSAHRSGAAISPENTLMAFEECLNSEDFKVDIFEFDTQVTKDGELILLHNLTYDSTSNAIEAFGRKKIKPGKYTYDELQVLNLGENFNIDGKYPYRGLRGDNIPYNLRVIKCRDVLKYIEDNSSSRSYQYIIDIKLNKKAGYDAVDELYQILKELNILDRTVFGNFHIDMHAYVDKAHPDMNRSASITEVLKFYFNCRRNKSLKPDELKFVALHIPYTEGIKKYINLGTKELINYAHKYNISAQYWTVNDKQDMRYLIENNADCIMTDKPDVFYNVLVSGSSCN